MGSNNTSTLTSGLAEEANSQGRVNTCCWHCAQVVAPVAVSVLSLRCHLEGEDHNAWWVSYGALGKNPSLRVLPSPLHMVWPQ